MCSVSGRRLPLLSDGVETHLRQRRGVRADSLMQKLKDVTLIP